MQNWFEELLGVDSATAFQFFLSGLREVTDREPCGQMLYVASVLAHHCQTSRYDVNGMPALTHLGEVFDNFVMIYPGDDPEMLEIAGSQIILLAGFFRDQMRRRRNLSWYDGLGQSFYDRASRYTREMKKRELFTEMATSLPHWNVACRDLSRLCRDNRYVLKIG